MGSEMPRGPNYNINGTELGDDIYEFIILEQFCSQITQNLFSLRCGYGGDNKLGWKDGDGAGVTTIVLDESVWFSTLSWNLLDSGAPPSVLSGHPQSTLPNPYICT